jgi:tetratricopeptide (TPR) repeat protein
MISSKRLPYPGLRAFTREESDIFFGRDDCVNFMVDRLAATRFLAVLGPSGSGKSSLVRTGLLEALDLGLHPTAASGWKIAELHPGGQPMCKLASSLLQTARGAVPDKAEVEVLVAFLGQGPRALAEWMSYGNLPPGSNLLLLVDQFEELFRYGDYAQKEETEAFVGLLLESAASSSHDIHVVITMRSEYLGACASIKGLAERISSGLYLTPRMSREECREAIEGPGSVLGFTVEPALVNRLLNDLASFAPWERPEDVDLATLLSHQADQLPLMQHVLNRLWARADSGANGAPVVLKLADYDHLGGLSGALDEHGTEVLASLGSSRIRAVENVFRALLNGTSLATAVRRPCRMGELIGLVEAAGDSRDDAIAVVEAFRAPGCNFLRTTRVSLADDDVIVDISHESLIRQWTPLRQWLEKEVRDGLAWRRLIQAEAHYRRHEGGLLAGLDLSNLTAWWESAKPTPAWASRHGGEFDPSRAFMDESRHAEAKQAETKRKQRMFERLTVWAGIALFVTLLFDSGVVKFAYFEKKRADDYQQRFQKGLSQAQDFSFPSDIQPDIQSEYKLGETLSEFGSAREAMEQYRNAYTLGWNHIASLPAAQRPSDRLAAEFIKDGYRYAWFLLDNHENKDAQDVIAHLDDVVGRYDLHAPPVPLLLSLAKLENLKSRISLDGGKKAEAAQHCQAGIDFASRALAADPSADAMNTLFTLYRNHASDEGVQAAEQLALRNKACALADQMLRQDPKDVHSISARVECLQDRANDAIKMRELPAAGEDLRNARELLDKSLELDPEKETLLLARASVEADTADLSSRQSNNTARHEENISAKNYFVRALKSKTVFQSSTEQVKFLYQTFRNTDFQKGKDDPYSKEELDFYKDVTDAMKQSVQAFPNNEGFAYVAADASVHVGELLRKDSNRVPEAETYLSQGINWFNKSGVMRNLSTFSEDFSAYCGAYRQRAELYAVSGRLDLMLRDVKQMKSSCTPALDKYPWDFYLRFHFLDCAKIAGKALFDAQRYAEALPHLQYASAWGVGDSTKLLARMYREGSGVPPDEKEAKQLEDLAVGQTMKRFTIPADFNGVKAPFYIYVRSWPAEYVSRFPGIDDQAKWLKEARGGILPPEVIDSFHKLQKIAQDNKVSFPELCEYALSDAGKDKAQEKPAEDKK